MLFFASFLRWSVGTGKREPLKTVKCRFYWKGKIMYKLETCYVGTGSYYVDKSEPLVLEAYLGTCVRVVLYDSEGIPETPCLSFF